MIHSRSLRLLAVAAGAVALTELVLVRLGHTYGSTPAERRAALPGDDIVATPTVVTDHGIDIEAPPDCVWPWLLQMGWHRGGWYTARWVDRLLFPANDASADRIIPELQHLAVGSFVPDGPPESECGLIVERLDPYAALVLHSTTHLPKRWREKAALDWSWAFVLSPVDGGAHTRFVFRSRWTTAPWWLTVGGRVGVVPADFVMSRAMLRGVKTRAEALHRSRPGRVAAPET
jgi:hypothetical protein